MARRLALAVALVVALLPVSGAGGAGAQTPKRGGTVVFGPIPEPSCLNPLVEACSSVAGSFLLITEKVVMGAFALAPDFTARPRLVSRATFTRTSPFTLTYHIRPEARWNDGVPVSARDFVFTHRAILSSPPEAWMAGIHRAVKSVRAVDEKTVRVVLRSRYADWRLGLFGTVLPQHALAGESLGRIWSDRIDNPKTGTPIGSGPFLVERWERGRQLVLRRNPNYWGAHPAYLNRLVIRFCQACGAPAEVLELIRQGDVDVALSRDTGIVPDLRRTSGVNVFAFPSNGWEHLAFRIGRGGHPALRSKLVRRALAYGIDRDEIVRRLFEDIDPRSRPSHSAAFQTTSPFYAPNWNRYSHRPALARSLLERAGCRSGADGIYSCGGERLSFRFLTTAGARLRERGLELVQAQLRRVGVEVLPTFAPGLSLFDQILPAGDFDAASFTWFTSNSSAAIANKDIFGCGSDFNYPGYCQRLVTEDLDQADRILDARQRADVLNRVDRQLARDVPVLPLYQVPFVLAYRRTVQNANVAVSPSNLFWNAENWWLDR